MEICELLKKSKHICVVGISDKPERESGVIALLLKEEGYLVTGVHPTLRELKGIKVYPSLTDVPGKIDIVDVFMNAKRVPDIIDDVLQVKPDCFWLQLGIRNDEAVKPIAKAGIQVIQDHCIAVEHRLCSGPKKPEASLE
ncbi:MAG: CoA-binding protein [Ignavibacteriales bacterium]|nr:MAG: CoA-binding protein [Ignavibacteriaceae bacterium]MBW7873929.1 CoA-binding protein [Ignavibacteria bacterium]MCZ2143312.1 CoA-binding protein [Ignavibacteriales bacterium]OQY75099.1 MAG: hypothetical protein B6D45_06065 [Ignavibacteriales bacterium UTCHB3]MBV6444195.1 putative protein YccU [Ignavibacteriaceae bacterium]